MPNLTGQAAPRAATTPPAIFSPSNHEPASIIAARGFTMEEIMNSIANLLGRTGLLKADLDYHLLRAAMVIIFAWFGYDKWFEAEIRGLLPVITNGPLISWTIPLLGIKGTAIFLGTAEWTFGTLLLLGFWNKKAGMLGAAGSTATFISTLTVMPFVPNAWLAEAGGFPAMTINSAFLLKDLVLLVVSIYLLKQDTARVIAAQPKR
ncbi:YkgB family protein [Sphingopyxis fribergensis]